MPLSAQEREQLLHNNGDVQWGRFTVSPEKIKVPE
jgi:hypothetical protein